MDTQPAFKTEPHQADAARQPILVWDAPVRIVHWLMVLCFTGAYLTAEVDSLRLVHVTFGYTMAGLAAFRLVWDIVGSRHARFASFVRGPGAVMRYLRSLLSGHPEHHAGHNPAGALAIIAMLAAIVVIVATGWAYYNEIGGEWTEEVHEAVANLMLALVVIHVVAVLASSWLHRENLVGAMVHGKKKGPPGEAIGKPWRALGALLLAAVLAFWWYQWQVAAPLPAGERGGATHQQDDHDD